MYKYYNEEISLCDMMAISNCLNYITKKTNLILDNEITKNINKNAVNLPFVKKIVSTQNFAIMVEKYRCMQERINYYNKYSKDELINLFLKYTENNVLSYIDIALVLNELNKKILMIDNDAFLVKYIFYHNVDLCNSVERLIDEMPQELHYKCLNTIIESKFTLLLMKIKKIETFQDIQNINIELLYLMFLEDIEKLSCIADTYLYILNNIESFHTKILKNICKENELYVIDHRYSLGGINQTLDEIGKQLNVTRERARQIIKKVVDKLKKYKDYFLKIIGTLFDIYKTDDNLLPLEVLIKFLGKENVKYYLAILLDKDINLKTLINYDEEYKVIYYNNDLNRAIDTKILILDNIILLKDLENYTIFEKQIIEKKYRKRDTYYIKTNVNKSLIYCGIIDELFPNGCKIYDQNNISLINQRYCEIYDIDEKIDGRVLRSYIERENYCMIDFGTFVNRNVVVKIDAEFKALIINYIYKYRSVYYSQIFEKFKERFYDYNVTNWYYVKGIIDDFSGCEIEHKKSYVQIKDANSTPIEEICQFAKKQEHIFSIEEINNKFPGIKNYIIYNVLYLMDDVIFIAKERFVIANKIKISSEDIELIRENIEFLFKSLKTKIISAKKLYSRMKILHTDFFNRNDLITDDYSLFSILKSIFKEEYYFYRPLIGKEKINSNSTKEVILNYLEDYEIVKVNFIANYIKKMNIRYLKTDEIFQATSEQFLQIDKETIMKKENAGINKFELEAINKSIKMYIHNYGACYVSKINTYVNFPIIQLKWNKYLLLGIVRSFLNEKYTIIQTNKSNNYLNLEFEIRRKNIDE